MNRPIKLRHYTGGGFKSLPVQVPSNTVEFTGVVDYFGVEIWEGDIVRWNHFDESAGQFFESYYKVVFLNGCFGTMSPSGEDFAPYERDKSEDVVVGNVFADSHLLTQSLCLQW